jgi:hypothetical protein
MSDQQNFERLLPKLNAFAEQYVRIPDMPVEQAIMEAERMATAAAEDTQTLVAVGFDGIKIKELDTAIGSLRFAQANFIAAMGELMDATRQWEEEEPKAYELRAEILAAVSFGLRNIPDAQKVIHRIREGSGKRDMIEDLAGLAQIGKKYSEDLKKINFDLNLLETAAKKAVSLTQLYAKTFIEKGTSGTKSLRNRAFTYMRLLMGEILDAAEYAFRKDTSRLDYYHSAFRSRRNSPSNEPIASTPEPVTA